MHAPNCLMVRQSGLQGLRYLPPMIGQVLSGSTMWRFLNDTDDETASGLNRSLAAFRRRWWDLLPPDARRAVH